MESVRGVGEEDRGMRLEKEEEEALLRQGLGKTSRARRPSPCRCGISFGNSRETSLERRYGAHSSCLGPALIMSATAPRFPQGRSSVGSGKPFPEATGSSTRVHRGLSPGVPKVALVEPAETPGPRTPAPLLQHFLG